MNIIIFSRPIRSGKTTELQQWCAARKDVGGILMPDMDGERYFEEIGTGERWKIDARFQIGDPELGRFRFSKKALNKALASVTGAPKMTAWLIIDEVGKLELRDEGFAPLIRWLETREEKPDNLLLVVRDSLLDAVNEHFGLKNARIVTELGLL